MLIVKINPMEGGRFTMFRIVLDVITILVDIVLIIYIARRWKQ